MTKPVTGSMFIEEVQNADTKDDIKDGIIFTSLFDKGVGLLQLRYSYPTIAGLLGISAPTVMLWRAGVILPSEAIVRREILEKLVVALM